MKCGTVIITMAMVWVGTLAQQPGTEEQIPFQTINRDACIMTISGQEEKRVRIECKNQGNNILCEFVSKPSHCRAFNKDQKGFWNQLSQDLENGGNPCEPKVFKHSMCPKAPAPSQFKQVNPRNQQSDTSKSEKKPPPTKKPTTKKPPSTRKPDPPKPKQPEEQNPKAVKMAKDHCSWFFQTFCSYIIEIFV